MPDASPVNRRRARITNFGYGRKTT